MRTYTIYGATFATVALLGASMGACSDGSNLVGTGGTGSAGTGATSGGMATATAGTTGVIPTAGTDSNTPTAGTGTNPTTGGSSSDAGTGGMPTVTAGSSTGGTGGSATGGTATGGSGGAPPATGPFKILIISTALEFPHDSIPDCQKLVADLGKEDPNNSWTTKVEGDDLADFTTAGLKDYAMIFSCNPTGRVFSGGSTVKDKAGAMKAFQDFIEVDGKAFGGVHSASDFEKTGGFPWFTNTLMGAYFQTHDNEGTSGSVVSDSQNKAHIVLGGLEATYSTTDEWYKMNRDPGSQPGFKILQRLASDSRPLTWVKDVGAGRMFYTVRGHAKKVYTEAPFRSVVKNGILWATKRIN